MVMNDIIWRVGMAGGLALILAGCGSKTVTAENASTAEVAQKVKESGLANGSFVSPGHWQTTMMINDMKIPGMPPEMSQQMKGRMGQAQTSEHCVTEEEAKKPKEDFFAGNQGASCRYENFTMDGGKIAMVMHCGQNGGKQTVTMNGTYSPDSYHMTMTSTAETKAGSPMGGMTLNATIDAKRVGECTGKEVG
jgi:hypothetical protein